MQSIKTVLFLGFSFFVFHLQAQDDIKISYGIEANLNLFTHVFEESEYIKNIHLPSGSIGGMIYLHLTEKTSLKSGLNFHLLNVTRRNNNYIFGCDIQSDLNHNNSYREDKHQLFYFGIPIDANWKFYRNKKSGFYLNLGQEFLFRLKERTTFNIYECGEKRSLSNTFASYEFSKLLMLIKLGVSYQYNIKEKVSIYIQPNIRYSINPILINGAMLPNGFQQEDRHLLNIGITTGVKF